MDLEHACQQAAEAILADDALLIGPGRAWASNPACQTSAAPPASVVMPVGALQPIDATAKIIERLNPAL